MELELKFTEVTGYEPVGDLVTTQEESMETAIPEYCPDMARIVDTVGQLRLREKHLTGQQLTVSGSVVLTVLYTSEESAGLRSLSMEVPFSCQVEDKRLEGISDIRDETDRTGMRIVIEVKHDANPQVVLNRLFAQTQLQTSFAINMLALVDNQKQPKILSLRHIIDEYLTFQEELITRRTQYDLKKAREREHLLQGLLIAQDNIDEIIEASYGIMVARGDLGVELPAEAIPNTQRRIVEKCICAKRPVIIATQMLYSMVKSPRPTRAEVSDVASAIYERVDAVMLSDETAMGDFPVESVETMARIAREIERDETHFKPMIDMDMVSVNHEITAQLARSAVRASTNLPIKYVVLDTKTGRTGRYLAAFRGQKTVMAVCYQLHAQRILALSYGVVPILRNQELKDRYHFLIDALEVIEQHQKLDGQDLLAIVGGSFGPDGGASYVEIANVLNIRRRNEEIVAAQKS